MTATISATPKNLPMSNTPPNGSRLSCGALKNDSFNNLRAPPASTLVRPPRTSGVVNPGEDDAPAPVRCDPLEVLSINEPELGRNVRARPAGALHWIENEAAAFAVGSAN